MTTTPKSISGLTSAAAARVVLWQSREFVTVPGNAMGLQASIPATGLLPSSIGGTGQVLAVVGGVPTWVEPAEKFVAAGAFSGTEDDIDLSAWIAQGFRRYKVMWSDWFPSTTNQLLCIRLSLNAGSSFQITGYASQQLFAISSAPTTASASGGASSVIQLTLFTPNTYTSHGHCELNLGSVNASWITCSQSIHVTGPAHGVLFDGGVCGIANANAIRLFPTAGNHGGGKYSIHALKDF